MSQRLFLIDGYSTIFRAYYAIRNLSNSRGEATNAVYGFTNILRKLLREMEPDLLGVALDVSRKTVRTERYAEYKANRRPMPDDLRPQIPWVRRVIEGYRIPILELEGFEADDVLGTLAARAREAGYEVVLVSADKDLMQLVRPGVSMFHTGREKLYGPAEVEEDFGVPPEQVVDVLALMGDPVDNVPGVPGIGEKGAKGLVRDFGSLDALLERAGEVTRKSYREGLQNHRDQALLSKELVTIHTDLEVPFDAERLRLESPDPQALAEIFGELEFFSLLEEIEGQLPAPATAAAEPVPDAETWRAELGVACGQLTLALVGPDRPAGLVVRAPSGRALYADFRRTELREAVLESLAGWIAEPDLVVVGHDLKEMLRLVPRAAAEVAAELFDVMLVGYVLRPSMKGHDLPAMALEGLRTSMGGAKDAGWGRGVEPAPDDPRLLAWAGEHLDLVERLAAQLREELGAAESLERIYRELEVPLLPILLAMEETGVLLDQEVLTTMSGELGEELDSLEREVYELAGEEFNLNSPQQLGVVLFEKLGLPVLKKTKKTKSYSTSAETLEELAGLGHELPARVIRYRELSKLKSTYVDALPELVAADGRLHTRFNQAVAATGRLSSANPNLQNIPIRTEEGHRIRKAFVASPGHLLLAADYSQIELRILAHISGDESLTAAFREGADIHRTTAANVFGVSPFLVSDEQRRAAKTINFGIIYGMSPYGLGRNLGIHPREAKSFIDAYMERYPGVRRYMDETVERAEEEGRVETLSGRVRYVPEIRSRNWNVRENAKRMAINARIQGTAADLMKQAMIEVDRHLRERGPAARLLLTVHDELVLEVPADEVEALAAAVRREMQGVAELAVPLVVDTGWGPTWYDAKG